MEKTAVLVVDVENDETMVDIWEDFCFHTGQKGVTFDAFDWSDRTKREEYTKEFPVLRQQCPIVIFINKREDGSQSSKFSRGFKDQTKLTRMFNQFFGSS